MAVQLSINKIKIESIFNPIFTSLLVYWNRQRWQIL